MPVVKCFTFNPFQENTYVVSKDGYAFIIDPGCYEKEECAGLADYITTSNLQVKMIINTHGHIDHVLGNHFTKTRYKVPLAIHEADMPVIKAVSAYAPNYGFQQYTEALPDHLLTAGETLRLGDASCEILFLPGHAPGHIGLFFREQGLLISGDVLFRESIGRTDLPGGDHDTLLSSIRTKLYNLPDTVRVFPGHGPETTIGYEKKHNPFCPHLS